MVFIIALLSFNLSTYTAQKVESIISKKLYDQAKCWNSGDLSCFMQDYWKNDSLMYIGSNGVTYGWQNTMDNYKRKYPSRKAMGHLVFDIVTINRINQSYYFMVGTWHLKRDQDDLNGYFSLIWKKIDGEWVIITDHSS